MLEAQYADWSRSCKQPRLPDWREKTEIWQALAGRRVQSHLSEPPWRPATSPGPETLGLKLELDDQERRAVRRSLVERRAHLIESTEDTTQTRAAQRSGLLELKAITSVLRKMRLRIAHRCFH